ncbi:DNA polymerase III subunit delta' [Candidatus Ruminimicrobium bovinum]|uniref:DNA polymerase III subunit delta' n=1 Tax=Candidatus Ruminimicrobium bovinum TaxID=3242779 RepID=UPI0039B97C81
MFENIIAQNKAKSIVSEQIKNNKIPHAYLFMGEDGIGKKKFAFEFAKILNCSINEYTKTDIGSCGHCENCKMTDKNSFPDLHLINFDKQNEIAEKESDKNKTKLGIDLIRYMQKYVSMKKITGKWKIFIIEPAEKMTLEAFNSLLKTLEEPPEDTILILIAKHRETIPTTILSRVQSIYFQPLPEKDIIKYLEEVNSLSTEAATKIAKFSDGSIAKAEQIMLNTQNEFSSLWQELTKKKLPLADIVEKSKKASRDREEAMEVIDILTEYATADFRREPDKFAGIVNKLCEYKSYLNANINASIVMDNLFIYINSKI